MGMFTANAGFYLCFKAWSESLLFTPALPTFVRARQCILARPERKEPRCLPRLVFVFRGNGNKPSPSRLRFS